MQPDDAMNDTALDRELERAFAIDPAPEFVARVRARIADEPMRSWHLSWVFGAAAVATIVAAVVVVQLVNRTPVPAANTPLLTVRALAPVTGTLPDRSVNTVAFEDNRQHFARGSTGSPRAVSESARPELVDQPPRFALRRSVVASAKAEGRALIDPRESAALRALIAGVRSGRVDLGPVVHASTPTAMDLPPIQDIVISPITIEPLAPNGAEGVRQ